MILVDIGDFCSAPTVEIHLKPESLKLTIIHDTVGDVIELLGANRDRHRNALQPEGLIA
ncbi:hypothetical protein SAMN05518671_1547 [Stenotrophomonas lactitubi]|nr:hypothetical protein SAMN04487863_2076 [Stenotrophomonas sp. yr243]SNS68244.1 hypothetical protein SAMN05518671_1547 [Stenotrophomonas lactitubi]